MRRIDGKLSSSSGDSRTKAVNKTNRSKRPYLVRAMHEWMTDNNQTPHIVVNAFFDGVSVPAEHIKDGKIILNISDSAAHDLKLSNDAVSFRARFGGVPFDVWAPMRSVLGIYARETGQGMIFSHDSEQAKRQETENEIEETRSRPHLTIVK
jgi:stringent starvation protein B